jgi:type I restriction enzyme S subunit
MSSNGWARYKLEDIAVFHDSSRVPLNSREREKRKGKYPYYGASGIVDYIDNYIFDGEYVLISEDGENLRSRQTPIAFKADGKFWVNNHAHVVKGKETFLNDWIIYFFQNLDINPYITGAVQPKLNKENLQLIEIPLPDFDKAKKIVSILSALDEKIELNRQVNVTLEAMAQAIFREWFVEFNYPLSLPRLEGLQDFHDYAVNGQGNQVHQENQGKDGALPQGWRVGKLGEVIEIKGGTTPRTKEEKYWNGEYYWATPKDLSNLSSPILLDTERKITKEGVSQIGSGILPKGTLLLSSRAPIGYLAISNVPISINQGFIAINAKELSNLFMLHWLKENMETIISRANGSTFLEISKTSFKDIELVIPDTQTATRFEEIVSPIFEQIKNNNQQTATLAAVRDALLPKLMSGEIIV